jgi:putative transposase
MRIFEEICQQYGWTIKALEVMPDHVHLFITTPPFDAPSKMAKLLKGISARKIFQLFPDLREELWEGHLWSPSYYCGTAGTVSAATIQQYIDSQRLK